MGGGDLNTKKSWHPNTMKNQERVWKAEQAAAEENKRIIELQHEREVEKDRTELNNMIKKRTGTTEDNRLHWMYDKPDKKVKEEDFLLGRAIDKDVDKPEPDAIPALSRRVVGSSMLTSGGDSQVDIARKIREDPLLLIKERERAARAALLNNPLQRKRLTELLRKEQLQKKDSKNEKKDKDLDNILAAKLNALGGDRGIDLASLLDSNASSSDSSSKEKSKKKKKKRKKEKLIGKSKKVKKKIKYVPSDTSEEDIRTANSKKDFSKHKESHRERKCSSTTEQRKRKSDDYQDYSKAKKYKRDSTPPEKGSERGSISEHGQQREASVQYNTKREKRKGLTDEEISLRLVAMAAAGAEREKDRSKRVAEQRAADVVAEAHPKRHLARSQAHVLPDSVESRIHSNRHYIQRNSQHMSENFARR